MKVLGIIPARYGSSRFPGKPLIDIKGKTMIQRVYEGASKCPDLNRVIVATDDDRIFDHVQAFGGEAMMTLSTHQSGTERCGEIAARFPELDIVVNIQGDEPLVDPRQLSLLIKAFNHQEVNIATLVSQHIDMATLNNPNRIKVVVNHKNDALLFSRAAIPFVQHPSSVVPLRHIGLYGFRNEILQKLVALPVTELEQSESLEQLRWLYFGYQIRTICTEIETPNIDVPEDLEQVLKLL
ncbi:MAG: 3-deoxy-manno-octulosonate cytidylyltransferase [Cryomorphaceae bacterium]|nr:3-deoxy-manno-octulosonate cytidylyltransferase [Cryomorphaceae bacterium]